LFFVVRYRNEPSGETASIVRPILEFSLSKEIRECQVVAAAKGITD
jgi:hypothetical protein